MKKFFVLALMAFFFIPAAAQAQIKWHGQFDVLGYALDDGNFNRSGSSNTLSRIIVGANFGLAENIEGNASISYFSKWGDEYLAGQQLNNTGETGVFNKVRLIEANAVFKNLFDNDRFSLKAGRLFYDGGTFFNVGPRDPAYFYLLTGTGAPYPFFLTESGMDGAVFTYDNGENLKIDIGYSKLTNEDSYESEKTNVTFINTDYKFSDILKTQAYLYDFETTDSSYMRFEYLGVKPEINYGSLTASAEFAQCFGDDDGSVFSTRHTKDGYFAKVDASYDMEPVKVRGLYLMTGSEFYLPYTQNIYLGYYVTSALRGTYGSSFFNPMSSDDFLNFGVDYTINKFKLSLDYFRVGDRDAGNKVYTVEPGVQYNYSEDISFKGVMSYLGREEDGSDTDIIYILQASLKFGGK